ncbi:MAG: PadR family transcriptional regulator, partial [Vicinamibacteraceae bacterium]
PEGTLYPALHRLERAGLLSSRWSEVNGRRRRVYQLTARGQRALVERHDEWRAFARAVYAVVEGSI